MKLRSLLTCLTLVAAVAVQAQKPVDPYKGYNEETFMDMDFDPNLATPALSEKDKPGVRKAVLQAANSLKSKYVVELMRDDEVLVVSIPAEDLFLPNDTLLSDYADRILTGVTKPMADPMAYKIILAMHTDDTGSPSYREALSLARLNSVYEWFMEEVESGSLSDRLLIIPFSMGAQMPLKPNDTMANRRENRRLEIYFVPGPSTIMTARKSARK